MNNQFKLQLKRNLSILVLATTGLLFVYYLHSHPQFFTNLKSIRFSTIAVIIVAYGFVLLSNAAILFWSVRICNKVINRSEAMLLNSYSTLVNFFGPLQSGPGFRAIYLKQKRGVSIKAYAAATAIYYMAFGIFSLLMVCYGLNPLLDLAVMISLILLGIWFINYARRKYPQLLGHWVMALRIITITGVQVLLNVLIYLTELRTVNHHISLSQAFIYTGAANLALFVSLTPGAIGFRESFLLFSRRLHHISTKDILAASVIDRVIYFVFLGLLFVITLAFHAKDRLKQPVHST